MNKILSKAFKVLKISLAALLLIFIALFFLIRIPSVQTWLVQKVTNSLSKTLNAKVNVKAVDLEFFKTGVIEGIYIEDRQGDTLLYAEQLKTNIGIFSLLRKNIYINTIQLEGARINLYKNQNDSLFNYQFILDQFAGSPSSKEIKPETTTPGWTFGIGEINLQDVRFDMNDTRPGGSALNAWLGIAEITLNLVDFNTLSFDLQSFLLENSRFEYTLLEGAIPSDSTAPLFFPDPGITLLAEKLELKNNRFKYSDLNQERQKDALDYAYLDFKDISLDAEAINLTKDSIAADIKSVSLLDQSGFELKKLSADVFLNNDKIAASSLVLETPQTTLDGDILLDFKDFNDLNDFMGKVKLEGSFNSGQLAFQDLWQLVPAFRTLPFINTNVDKILFVDGGIVLDNNQIAFKQFDSHVGNELILKADGSISQLDGDPFFDLNITQIKTDYSALKTLTKDLTLPPGLASWGNVQLSGQVKGTVDQLKAQNLVLKTDAATRFRGDIQANGLTNIEKAIFKLNILDLSTEAKDLKGFSEAALPPELDSLGLINFKGNFAGTIYDFLIKGDLKTSAGMIKSEMDLNFNNDYSNGAYDGRIELQDFDLGKILAEPFGKVSLKAEMQGKGLAVDDLDTKLKAIVESFEYQNYKYQGIDVNGAFLKKRFEGSASAEDENIHFDFEGVVDLNSDLPDFQMTLNIDTLNLKALNLYEKELGLSGKLVAGLKGNSLDNLSGTANMTDFFITQDGESYAPPGKIALEALQLSTNKKSLSLRSHFINADIKGDFNLAHLQEAILVFVNDYFPMDVMPIGDNAAARADSLYQNLTFDFRFNELAAIAKVFLPDFSEADTAHISGSFNSATNTLNLDGEFPDLRYGDFWADTLLIRSIGTQKKLKAELALIHLRPGSGMEPSNVFLKTGFGDDSLKYQLDVLGIKSLENGEANQKLAVGGHISKPDEYYKLSFIPRFVLNNTTWEIDPRNQIDFTASDLAISNLHFTNGEQTIAIDSKGEAVEDDIKPISLQFLDFNLGEVSSLLGMEDYFLEGNVNGNLLLIDPRTNLHYNAEINIDDLTYNEKRLGVLDIKASQAPTNQIVVVNINLKGENQMSVKGDYNIPENLFDLNFDFGKVPLFVIDPFMPDILKDSEGYLAGNIKLKGTPDKPDISGKLDMNQVSTLLVISNSRYQAEDHSIRISEDLIDLGTFALKDAKGNTATLSGKVMHNYFEDIAFDLDFDTEAFQFLNTKASESELYYGDLFLKASVKIRGSIDLPRITINATTLENSNLFVQPFLENQEIRQEDYIIFANPTLYNADSIRLVEQKIAAGQIKYDLSLNLAVTKDATLNIIVDPETGDELTSKGTANLAVNVNPTGLITIAGNYTIEEGSYLLNYENLIKREFKIEKGSNILFTGDPMKARFNITASYAVRATMLELLNNQATLTDSEIQEARLRTDVKVLLKLAGSIDEPSVSFDITIPNLQSTGIESAVSRKLAALREDPKELNKQVFGLLFFNNFIIDGNSASDVLSGTGESIALTSVSRLISNQLNRFANRFLKGFEVNFGVESYRTGLNQESTVTQMQFNVSKQLFNERLSISAGTNLNLDAQQSSTLLGSDFSGIAGDFVLEYKLTENGNYLIKIFHRSDYNVLEEANTYKTGAGIVFRKSFNSKKQKEK